MIPIALRFAQATYTSLGQVEENLAGHQKIFDALMRRDTEEAAKQMQEHLANSSKNIEKIFEQKQNS